MRSGEDGFAVAVVDDDDRVRVAVARMLRASGYAVRTYGAGADFLRALPDALPACVILDLQMPGVDGCAVQAGLARDGFDVPVIIMTGSSDNGMVERAISLGALACLAKPVDEARLLDALAEARDVPRRQHR